MSVSRPSIVDTRRDQILPLLDATDIERAWRFGEVRRFATGEALAAIGEVGVGLGIILNGQVDVYRYDAHSERRHFFTFGPGSFLGELAQLAGRPSFGDAVASEPVKALIFSPDRMRALLIAEAELGERLMCALILRRTQMLQDGVGGPVIVGRSENPNVIRLEGFLARNGTPRMHLDPETDPEAKALIDRFHVDPGQLPIVICPGGEVLRDPMRTSWRAASDWSARSIRSTFTISPSSARDRPALPLRFTRRRRDCPCWCWIAARSAVRPAHRHASRIISAFRPASAAWR